MELEVPLAWGLCVVNYDDAEDNDYDANYEGEDNVYNAVYDYDADYEGGK